MAEPAGGIIPTIFGGGTGVASYDELKRRQAIAQALAAQKRQYPKTLGEGMTYLGEAIGERLNDNRLRDMEAAQKARDRGALPAANLLNPKATAGAPPLAAASPQAFFADPEAAPQEVAQGNPTQGGPMVPPGSPSDGEVISDAAPIGGPGDQLALSKVMPAERPVTLPTNLSPRIPEQPPAALADPNVENDPTPTSIQPAPVQVAQVGPAGLPSSMFNLPPPAFGGAPAAPARRVDAFPAPAAGAGPMRVPQAEGGRLPLPGELRQTAEPPPYAGPTVEPKRPGPTREMLQLRNVTENHYDYSPETRAAAAKRYQDAQSRQDDEFKLRHAQWTAKQEYERGDPQRRYALETTNVANQKAVRDLLGEGYAPMTPEEVQRLYPGTKVPEGQAVWKNWRGEPKFGPTAPKTEVNIDTKATSKGMEEIEKKMAEHIVEQFTQGSTAGDDLRTLTEMRVLQDRVPTGGTTVLKHLAGKYGIKTEGISDIEAYGALVNRLTPQQRVPGSGATSDFDASMFKASIPALMNTPNGNRIIMDTMEGIAKNKMDRAEIAGKVVSRQMTLVEGTQALLKLQIEARGLSDRVKAHLEATGAKVDPLIPRSPEDNAAIEWATKNPEDPRAIEIKRRHGAPYG